MLALLTCLHWHVQNPAGAQTAAAEAPEPVALPSFVTCWGLEEFHAVEVNHVCGKVRGIKHLMVQLGSAKSSLVRERANPTRMRFDTSLFEKAGLCYL